MGSLNYVLCFVFFKCATSLFNATAGLEMVHRSGFGLNVVFSVTEQTVY